MTVFSITLLKEEHNEQIKNIQKNITDKKCEKTCFICSSIYDDYNFCCLKYDKNRDLELFHKIFEECKSLYSKFIDHVEKQKKCDNNAKKCNKNLKKIWIKKGSLIECSICLSFMYDKIESLPKCKHQFHKDCIDMWKKKNLTCPLCKIPLKLEINEL